MILKLKSEGNSIKNLESKTFSIKAGAVELETKLAISNQTQTKGLSGIQGKDFRDDQAMLFLYPKEGYRRFWMPDTYFNLALLVTAFLFVFGPDDTDEFEQLFVLIILHASLV